MRPYSEAVKADVRRRMGPPHRQSVAEIAQGLHLARFLWKHCHVRPSRSLGDRSPYEVYHETTTAPSRSELMITVPEFVQ